MRNKSSTIKEIKDTGKVKNKKLPTQNKQQLIERLIISFIALIVILIIFFLVKNIGYNSKLSKQAKQINSLDKQVYLLKEDGKQVNNIDVFCRYFISDYYKTNVKSQADFDNEIKKYFASDIKIPQINTNSPSAKELKSIQLWEKIAIEKNTYKMSYLISYKINDQSQKELVTFNIKEKDNQYQVITSPYFSSVPDLTFKSSKRKEVDLSKKEKASDKEKENIDHFLKDTFLPKYYNNTSSEEMKYLMDTPISLGNSRSFEKIEKTKIVKEGKKYIILATIEVKDRSTSIKEYQDLKIEIKKNSDGKIYITSLEHL